MSVIELASLRAKPGHGAEMREVLPAALSIIAEAEGCLGATSMQCIERPDEFVLRITWVAVSDHEAFRATPDFARFRAELVDHLGEVVAAAHYIEQS
jgi:quinol monooxygenase YgiN